MISVFCTCGKQVFGSEGMAGQEVQCFKCRRMVALPGPIARRLAAAPAAPIALEPEEAHVEQPAPLVAPVAASRWRDSLYWVLLLALLPLVGALFHQKDPTPLQRLEKTLKDQPSLRARVEAMLHSEAATLDDVLMALPGQRIDGLAHLPRKTDRHLVYAAFAAGLFSLLIGVMAHKFAPAWKLALAAGFTATFGIACLFLFHDFLGQGHQATLEEECGLIVNLVAFTAIVGLGEELCKALVVIFYLRTHKDATWRGACFWGMASGVGFGIAEAISYAARSYNGISQADTYLMRYASCVALHAVWSAAVGIALFNARHVVHQVVNAIVYLGDLDRWQLVEAVLQVLGVAMFLHGAYDALLTQDLYVPALLTALASFGWLGWQIETAREREARERAVAHAELAPA